MLSPVTASSPVVAQDPVKVAAAATSAPAAGSTAVPALSLSFSEDPTGEIEIIRPSSGPVSVPEIDDWNEPPEVRIRLVQPKATPEQ